MISYYELLGMIKEDKAPKEIRVHLTSKPKIYKAIYDFGDFNYYKLYEEEIIDDDYKDYLAECFLESSMFEKNIEILDEKKDKKIHWEEKEGLNGDFNQKETITILARRTEKLKKAFNEIIEYMEEN